MDAKARVDPPDIACHTKIMPNGPLGAENAPGIIFKQLVRYKLHMSKSLESTFRAMLPEDPFGTDRIPVYTTRDIILGPQLWTASKQAKWDTINKYFRAPAERLHLRPGVSILGEEGETNISDILLNLSREQKLTLVGLLPLDQAGFNDFTQPLHTLAEDTSRLNLLHRDYQYYVEVPDEFVPLRPQRPHRFNVFNEQVGDPQNLRNHMLQKIGLAAVSTTPRAAAVDRVEGAS